MTCAMVGDLVCDLEAKRLTLRVDGCRNQALEH